MITFRIKCVCEEVSGFVREIEINSRATFLDLNKAILDSCGYQDDQMTSFYICDEEWKRIDQITREDMGMSPADEDIYVMSDTKLSTFIEDEGQKIEYVFDPFSERSFYLVVKEEIFGHDLKTPKVLVSKGNAPQQIADLNFDVADEIKPAAKNLGTMDLDGDAFLDDASEFEDGEIDFSGFEINDGENY